MKSFFKIAVGVCALSLVQQASAANIRITGSTAFRGAVHDTIVAMMGGTPASNSATCKIATTASAPGTVNDANNRSAVGRDSAQPRVTREKVGNTFPVITLGNLETLDSLP